MQSMQKYEMEKESQLRRAEARKNWGQIETSIKATTAFLGNLKDRKRNGDAPRSSKRLKVPKVDGKTICKDNEEDDS